MTEKNSELKKRKLLEAEEFYKKGLDYGQNTRKLPTTQRHVA